MTLTTKITWLTLFSIAMGFMETVIVVYLRELYYPNGFQFPLVMMDQEIIRAELLREAATVIMLLSVGMLSGRTASQKFAFFIFCFAIWDLFYYIFLKALLDWPESLFTWDILFLIPMPWVGPVWAPCVISVTMILLAAVIVYYSERGYPAKIDWKEWILFIAGSIVVTLSFVCDSMKLVSSSNGLALTDAVPTDYNWHLFWIGELLIVLGIVVYFKRIRKAAFSLS